jgi:hypothetical protein
MPNKKTISKKAQEATSTQSRYIDSSGKVFSAQEIVQGYKPKKPYKLHSLSGEVSSASFGKKKENKK